MRSLNQKLIWLCAGFFLITFFPVIPVRAEIFTPSLDGSKAAGEYTNANSYQVIFTDPSISTSETGTVYTGRNTSHVHFALEIAYPAGDAKGSTVFVITYGEKIPHESQIVDRKGVIYFYELASESWKSVMVDQNQKQGTSTAQNETAIDITGAGGKSQTKLFVEISIPIAQTDAEPYDRHLVVDERVAGGFSMQRGYYNSTENTDWEFNGLSETYYVTLGSDNVTLEKASETTTSPGFGLLVASMAAVIVVSTKKKRKK